VERNLALTYSNSCGILQYCLLSKSTGLSAFPSTRLRSSTFDITGLLAGVGRRLPYVYRVTRPFGLTPGLSYPLVGP